MSVLDKMKAEQHDEESDLLVAAAHAKLEALWLELGLLKRSVRLTDDESTRLLMSSLYAFAAEVAVEEGSTREEFLKLEGELFDDALEEIAEEEDEDEAGSDKGSTDGGPAPVVVS